MDFTTKKIDIYGKNDEPKNMVSNDYETSHYAIRQPCLLYASAVRASGKSFSVSKIVRGLQREKVFDRITLITPTFNSNKAYFGDLISNIDEDVFEPTRDSIQKVIDSVERDRDEFEEHLEKLKKYNEFLKILKSGAEMNDDQILEYIDLGFLNEEAMAKPEFKYEKKAGKLRPPQTLLILDDVLSSPALLQSSGLTKIATLNRHVGPLKETFGANTKHPRSACGLAVILISQTYNMPQGVSRTLREQITHLLLFQNKQEKQLDKIRDELGSAVDANKFQKAYEFAVKEKYGNLLVDFNPREPELTFRKNLNELIIFDD